MIHQTYTYPGANVLLLRLSRARRVIEMRRRMLSQAYEQWGSDPGGRAYDIESAREHYAILLGALHRLNTEFEREAKRESVEQVMSRIWNINPASGAVWTEAQK